MDEIQFLVCIYIKLIPTWKMCVSLPRYLTTMYLMLALVLGLGLTAASPEPSLAESLEALTQTCDQSDNYVGILNAVHSSLDLQVTYQWYLHNSDVTTHSYNRSAWLTWSSRSLTWSTCCQTRCRPRGRHGETPLQSSRIMSTSVWSEVRYAMCLCADDSNTKTWYWDADRLML